MAQFTVSATDTFPALTDSAISRKTFMRSAADSFPSFLETVRAAASNLSADPYIIYLAIRTLVFKARSR